MRKWVSIAVLTVMTGCASAGPLIDNNMAIRDLYQNEPDKQTWLAGKVWPGKISGDSAEQVSKAVHTSLIWNDMIAPGEAGAAYVLDVEVKEIESSINEDNVTASSTLSYALRRRADAAVVLADTVSDNRDRRLSGDKQAATFGVLMVIVGRPGGGLAPTPREWKDERYAKEQSVKANLTEIFKTVRAYTEAE